jgi:hypothetical protein
MADQGGISDYSALANTSREARTTAHSGWASLGSALGGGGALAGTQAYDSGMRVGAQTIDALAQARQRINDSSQAEAAGQALESPQMQQALGLPQPIMNYLATTARMTGDASKVAELGQQFLALKNRSALADPNGDIRTQHAAANSLNPAGAQPHAEGPNGSVFDPLGNALGGQTTVGTDQHALTQSEIGQHNAAAGAETALTTQRNNNPMGGSGGGAFGKPPPGMRYQIDPTSMDYVLDNTGRPALEAIPGYNQAKGESGNNARFHENQLGAAEQGAREVDNITGLKGGILSSSGAAGVSGGHGMGGQISMNVGRMISDTNQQEYARSIKNFGRAVSMMENGGSLRAAGQGAAGSYQEQFENLPSDTPDTRAYGLALMRQAYEAQNEKIQNGLASKEQKAEMQRITDSVVRAIPFSPRDVSGRDTSVPIQQWLDSRYGTKGGGSAAAAPSGPPPGLRLVN